MLKQKLQQDAKEALKQNNQLVLVVLRMALSVIGTKEKEKRYKVSKSNPDAKEEDLAKESEMSDDEVISVISSEIKKRKDAISLYEKGGRPELADQEQKEITVLQTYLPEQLSIAELKTLVEASVKSTGSSTIKDMGRVMADLLPKVKGKADNAQISKLIKELLH